MLVAVALSLAVSHLTAVATIIASAPWTEWNEIRLACVAGLLEGYSLYATQEAGPILPWIYFPLSAFAFLPAALIQSPPVAVAVGTAIAASITTAPAIWLHFDSARRERLGATLCWIGFSTYGIVSALTPATLYSGYEIHVDAPALGATALACCALLRWLANQPRPGSTSDRSTTGTTVLSGANLRGLAIPAGLAAIAVGCKQTLFPLIAILVVWLAFERGWRAAAALGTLTMSILFVLLAASGAWLGFGGMWLNAIEIPRRHPLAWGEITYVTELLLPALACLAIWAAGRARRRARATGAQQGDSRDSALLVAVGLGLAPFALLARAKQGGDVNNYSLILYFLILAASLELPFLIAPLFSRRAPTSLVVRVASLLAFVTLTAGGLWSAGVRARATFLLGVPSPPTRALVLERERGNSVFFPHHPLVMLRIDGRLYHDAHAVADWRLAGLPLSDDRLNADLPADRQRLIVVRQLEELPDYLGALTRVAPPVEEAYDWLFFAHRP